MDKIRLGETIIVGVDPGTTTSAVVLYRPRIAEIPDTLGTPPVPGEVVNFRLASNPCVLELLKNLSDRSAERDIHMIFVSEMFKSYGSAMGDTILESCVWVGRFAAAVADHHDLFRLPRATIKTALLKSAKGNDSQVNAALVNLWGSDRKEVVGTAKNKGPLFGIKKDLWAALGVGVTAAHYTTPELYGACAYAGCDES